MAGDWIKLEAATPDKPEIYAIAGFLDCSHGDAFLACVRLWLWSDQQSRNGHDLGVTKTAIDRIGGVTGLCDALIKARWLKEVNGVLSLPNFDRHNGKTAKERALATKRKVTERSRPERDNTVTREEKRRDKESPVPPFKLPEGVDETRWQAFRESRRKLRKPMTAYAEQRALDTLVRLVGEGHDPAKLIDKAIENGWQTFYARDDCRSSVTSIARAKAEACPCGAVGIVKVGGKWRCSAHVRQDPLQAAAG